VGDDFKPTRKAQTKRKRVLTRSDKNLREYDAWRCVDRNLIVPTPKTKAVCKITVSPALIRQAFGTPDKTELGFEVSGQYDFEDTNLDLFRLFDYQETTFYHGFNREDSFYYTEKNMRRHEKRRVKKWPTVEEFWASEEPRQFRLVAGEYSDWKTFRRWLNRHLRNIEGTDFDYDSECLSKHESTLDICLGDYDKKEEINTEMAIFKWNNTIFMNKEDLEKVPKDKKMV